MHDANNILRRHIESQKTGNQEKKAVDIAIANTKETLNALKHKREETNHNIVRLITDEILKGEKKLENKRNNEVKKDAATFGDNKEPKSKRRASTQWGDPLERSDLIPLERDSKRMKAETTNIKRDDAKKEKQQRFIDTIIGSSAVESTGGGGGGFGSQGWGDSGGSRNHYDSYHYDDYYYDYGYDYEDGYYGDYYDWDESESDDADDWDDKKRAAELELTKYKSVLDKSKLDRR